MGSATTWGSNPPDGMWGKRAVASQQWTADVNAVALAVLKVAE